MEYFQEIWESALNEIIIWKHQFHCQCIHTFSGKLLLGPAGVKVWHAAGLQALAPYCALEDEINSYVKVLPFNLERCSGKSSWPSFSGTSPKLNGCLFISQSFAFIRMGDGLALGWMQHRQETAMLGEQNALFAERVLCCGITLMHLCRGSKWDCVSSGQSDLHDSKYNFSSKYEKSSYYKEAGKKRSVPSLCFLFLSQVECSYTQARCLCLIPLKYPGGLCSALQTQQSRGSI